MSIRPLAIILAILVFAPTAAAAINGPTYSAGDSSDSSSTGTNAQRSTTTTSHTELAGMESVTAGGQAYDAYKLVTTAIFDSKTNAKPPTTIHQQSTTTTWARVADGAILKTLVETDTTTSIPGYGGHTTQQTDYDAPCIEIAFPIDVGSSWTTACSGKLVATGPTGSQNTATNKTTTSQVLRKESVTVGAGTFDAYVIETQQSQKNGPNTVTTTWWAPLACAAAKVQSNAGGIDTTTELKAYTCAKGSAATAASATASATPTTGGGSSAGSAKKSPGAPMALVLLACGAAVLFVRRRG